MEGQWSYPVLTRSTATRHNDSKFLENNSNFKLFRLLGAWRTCKSYVGTVKTNLTSEGRLQVKWI